MLELKNNLDELEFDITEISSVEELAKKIKKDISPNDNFLLIGDLGMGKTFLVREILNNFNIDDYITSPTFSIMNHYITNDEKFNIYHLDLYRIEDSYELEEIGFYEVTTDGIVFIEWADKFYDYIREILLEFYEIKIYFKEDRRKLKIRYVNNNEDFRN